MYPGPDTSMLYTQHTNCILKGVRHEIERRGHKSRSSLITLRAGGGRGAGARQGANGSASARHTVGLEARVSFHCVALNQGWMRVINALWGEEARIEQAV